MGCPSRAHNRLGFSGIVPFSEICPGEIFPICFILRSVPVFVKKFESRKCLGF
jgi:hypothetical protein